MTADSRACVGLDAMLKASPGTPGLSERVFYWIWKRRMLEFFLRLATLNPS